MSSNELKKEESKELLLKKRKAAMIKKKRESLKREGLEKSRTPDSLTEEDRVQKLKLITEEDRLSIAKDLKINAVASFARYDFYKDGYKKTLGILLFSILTLMISSYSLIYATVIYQPKNAYIPVNPQGQVLEPYSLDEAIYTEKEIIDFASESYRAISSYNYVNLKTGYINSLRGFYTDSYLAKYKNIFLSSDESKFVLKNFFIVESVQLRGARIDDKKTEILTKQAKRKGWVVKLNTVKVYQNQKKYVRKYYETYVKIVRVRNDRNHRGIAVHSFVEIDKEK